MHPFPFATSLMVGGRARKPSKRALEAQTTEELFRDDPERKDDPAKDDDVEFVRKRSKTVKTSNKGPRKRGKLRQLSEMPIEIVCSVSIAFARLRTMPVLNVIWLLASAATPRLVPLAFPSCYRSWSTSITRLCTV